MRRVLKWVGIVLGGLVGLALLVAVGLYVSASVRMTRTYDLQP